ncbi:hypothetical protein Hanom_Chr01g00064681 [Helianthus anomalus]
MCSGPRSRRAIAPNHAGEHPLPRRYGLVILFLAMYITDGKFENVCFLTVER